PASMCAKWNGTAWSPLGTGLSGLAGAYALTPYNGELYVAGLFTVAGGNPASRVARWNGSTWSPLTSGTNNYTWSMCVYNSDLYIGGSFTNAGGNNANYIAKWNIAASGIQDYSVNNNLNIFPNPANDNLTIELKQYESSYLQIIDAKGQTCVALKMDSENTNVNISSLAKGIYFVKIINQRTTVVKKLIKD
ncbi:MAG: T9SS type A sorting domain-containing protein, partial [Bacteroidia bacterium]